MGRLRSVILFLSLLVIWIPSAHSTHAVGLDLTYEDLGGDTFALELTFYRDCDGVNAPGVGGNGNPVVDITSASCGYNLTESLPLITFQELATVCASLQTTCTGGTYEGVEEYIYRDTIVLPDTCSDWVFSYGLCCRNHAINTLVDTDVDIYVEATLDNTSMITNSSPKFSTTPVPFMCVGSTFCFNNGATDPDGDSLVYKLVTPTTGPGAGDTVEYVAGFDKDNPIASNPAMTFDPITGDICITPTTFDVSVMQVQIEEWRNGAIIGTVERDIQLRVINCMVPNTLPSVNGIDGTGVFTASICAGDSFNFTTDVIDPDPGQTVTMTWNQGIPDATFNISSDSIPSASFAWLADSTDISNTPHCFTVELTDDNCPFPGSQSFSFCITVTGFLSADIVVTNPTCYDTPNGTATVNVTAGTPPYTYLWSDPMAQTTATATGLVTGTYHVTVTDSAGCSPSVFAPVSEPGPLVVAMDSTNITCNNLVDGTATANVTGGTAPYSYIWDAGTGGQTTQMATGLFSGSYTVTITDTNGCDTTATVSVVNPPVLAVSISSQSNISCFGGGNGSATASPTGGTPPYQFLWDAGTGNQNDTTASGLTSGTYTVTVTDTMGCDTNISVNLTQPNLLTAAVSSIDTVLCFGDSNGAATVTPSGGTTPYQYVWDASANNQTGAMATGLPAGSYSVTVTDTNGCDTAITATVTEPAALVSTPAFTDSVNCFGGSDGKAAVSAAGGNGGYTYLWDAGAANQTSDTAFNLSAASYQVTVTDAKGCIDSSSTTIFEPALLVAFITDSNNVNCFGGNDADATVDATGGIAPYSFQWDANAASQTTAMALNLQVGSYVVTVTDANACTATDQITITEPTLLTTVISSNNAADCFGASTGSATTGPSGGTTPYVYLWDAGAGSQTTATASALAAGSYTVTVTDDNGCTTSVGTTITQPTLLIASTTVSSNALCLGDSNGSANASGAGGTTPYTFLWDVNAGSQVGPVATGLAAGSYTVEITDFNGCIASTSVSVTEPTALMASVATVVDVSCFGGSDGSIGTSVSGGTPGYAYSWDANAGSQTGVAAVNLSVGTYSLTITDNNGCTTDLSGTVAEPTLLTSAANVVGTISCYGFSDGIVGSSGAGGTTPYTYQWDQGTGSQTTIHATNLATGTYTVTITDAQGCTSDTFIFLGQPDSLTLVMSSLDVTCFGAGDGTAQVSVSGGTTPYSYLWNPGAGSQTTDTAFGLSDGTYLVTVTDNNGCVKSDAVSVFEPQPVNMNIGPVVDVLCFGGTDGWALASPSGGVMPYQFLWDANTGGQTSGTATNLGAGMYFVTLTDAVGCTRVDSAEITEPPELISNITASTNVTCFGFGDGTATVASSGGVQPHSILWDPFASSQSSAQAIGLVPNTYSVTVTDAHGCTHVSNVPITEPPPISVSTPPIDTLCVGDDQAISAPATGGNGGFVYTWDQGLGIGQSHQVQPDSHIVYVVTVVDQLGCPGGTDSVLVPVRNIMDEIVTATASGIICIGETATVEGFHTGDAGPYQYQWDLLGSGLGPKEASPIEPTNYTLSVTDACGNLITTSVPVMVDTTKITLDDTVSKGCSPLEVTFANKSDNGLLQYVWRFSNGSASTQTNPTEIFVQPGTYLVSVTATSNNGCEATADGEHFVRVYPDPRAGFTPFPEAVEITDPRVKFRDQSSGAVSWLWDFGNGDLSMEQSPLYEYPDIGSFRVIQQVTNGFGCKDTTSRLLRVDPVYNLVIPNAFTPNPNGPNGGVYDPNALNNDVFFPFTEYVENYHMMIFNRWGEMVFETFDINIGWDGYYKGKLSQQDVYVYKIILQWVDGEEDIKVGNLTLFR